MIRIFYLDIFGDEVEAVAVAGATRSKRFNQRKKVFKVTWLIKVRKKKKKKSNKVDRLPRFHLEF